MPNHKPSPQQEAIYDEVATGGTSLDVVAVAGSGKTTTLEGACELMKGSVVFTAYNKSISMEIGARLARNPAVGKNVESKTFHAIGNGAWYKQVGKTNLDTNKMEDICEYHEVPYESRGNTKKLVSLAKNHAIGCEGDVVFPGNPMWGELIDHYELLSESLNEDADDDEFREELIGHADVCLRTSLERDHKTIDFDDMIFSPLYHGAIFNQKDWVLVDEAQDTNPARRVIAARMLKPTGRAIFVGDPRQAIYGFTGANSDAMEIIRQEFKTTTMPLTVTYRCPKAIVRHAQRWVSHIEAAPSAPEGIYEVADVKQFEAGFSKLSHTDVILCRNTRPLVAEAFNLIRKGIACHVEGRDIGRSLVTLTKRYKIVNAREMFDNLEDWAQAQYVKLLSKRKEREAEALGDKIETIRVILGNLPSGASTYDLRKAIEELFGDTPDGQPSRTLTLSTIHRAKGREWDTVYLLGRTTYMPSKYAKSEWQIEQENNLIYVAVTRAKRRLVEVDLNKVPALPAEEKVNA